MIRNVIEGQYEKPVRVGAFNTTEGWSRDVIEDIAREIIARVQKTAAPLSQAAKAFVEWATGENAPTNLMDRAWRR